MIRPWRLKLRQWASWGLYEDLIRPVGRSALSRPHGGGHRHRVLVRYNHAGLTYQAEWEFACRAGTTTPFHSGSQLNGREANCDGNYPYGTTTKGPYLERPTTVGSYASNGFGLYDRHGNVHEWCADWFDSGYYANSPVDDPSGPTSGLNRVLRGGCWFNYAWFCRSANRNGGTPSIRDFNLGFRVAFSSMNQSGQ